MVVNYTVALRPLRLDCVALQGGHEYVVRYSRKGVECATYPQMCVYSGDVIFNSTPPAVWKPFQVQFEWAGNKRSVEFSVEDVTNKRKKVTCASGATIELVTCCSVFEGEAVHKIVEIFLRISGYNATLHVALLMFPEGGSPPPPPHEKLARLLATDRGGGGVSPAGSFSSASSIGVAPQSGNVTPVAAAFGAQSRKVRLSPAAASWLVTAGLLDSHSAGALFDPDIADELALLVAQLGATTTAHGSNSNSSGGAASEASSGANAMRIAEEVAAMERRLVLAATENRRLEAEAAAVASASDTSRDAGQREAAALRALRDEEAKLRAQLASLQQAIQRESAALQAASAANVAAPPAPAILSDPDSDDQAASSTPEGAHAASPITPGAPRAESEYLLSLRSQLASSQQQLAMLDAEQARRDVTAEVCELLDVIGNLEQLIGDAAAAEAQQQHQPTSGVTGAGHGHRGGIRKSGTGGTRTRKVTFADNPSDRDAASISPAAWPAAHAGAPTTATVAPASTDPLVRAVDELVEIRRRRRVLKYGVAGACAIIAGKDIPPLPALPPQRAAVAAVVAAAPTAAAAGAAAVAPLSSSAADLFNDILSVGPPSTAAPPRGVQHSAAASFFAHAEPSPPVAEQRKPSTVDPFADLFAPTLVPQAPPPQASTAPNSNDLFSQW